MEDLQKHSTPVSSTSTERIHLTSSPSKDRKSGRMRKKTSKGAEFQEMLERYNSSEKGVEGSSPSSRDLEQPVHVPSADNTTEKKKGGRPQKVIIQEDSQEADSFGAPLAQNEMSAEHSSSVSSRDMPKQKRRGRPPKVRNEKGSTELQNAGSSVASSVETCTPSAETCTQMSANTSSLEIPKRKRGRPRKTLNQVDDVATAKMSANGSLHETPKCKRGQPQNDTEIISARSSFVPSMESSPQPPVDMSQTSSLEQECPPQQVVSVKPELEHSTMMTEMSANVLSHDTPKRKRGRPRKKLNQDDSIENVSSSTVPSNESSTEHSLDKSKSFEQEHRPPQVVTSTPNQEHIAASSSAPTSVAAASDSGVMVVSRAEKGEREGGQVIKRKRGRPPKPKFSPESTASHDISGNMETAEEEPRIKRVRSPASQTEEEDEDSDKQRESTPKRKKGRPSTSHSMQEEVMPAKRGRKPGWWNTSSANQQSSNVEACLRCGEKMESLSRYKRHLSLKHAALYTSECPQGEQSHRAFQKILNMLKSITCPNANCRKPFKNPQYFRHHLEWCGREEERVRCEICGRDVKAMWMQQHIRDDRRKEAARKAQEDGRREDNEGRERRRKGGKNTASTPSTSDSRPTRKAAAASLERIRNVTEGSQEDAEGRPQSRKREQNHDVDWDRQAQDEEVIDDNDDDDDEDEPSGSDEERETSCSDKIDWRARRRRQRIPDAFQAHQDFLDTQPGGKLFPSLVPWRRDWTPLSESESAPYLPTTRQSVQVSVNRSHSPEAQPSRLQWGEALADNKQATAFVGGPVRTMEWCPLDAEDGSRDQVLAVSAGRQMWGGWPVFKRGEGPGLIQFWTTGPLDNTQSQESPSLTLAFTMAHNLQHVLSLAWCPRGGYLDPTSDNGDSLPRLGLLALSGYNSDVQVYSIPTPEAVRDIVTGAEHSSKQSSTPPCFKPPPSLTLKCADPDTCGACLSVAWQKGEDCAFIAAGYVRGFIHLWHLSSASPLVKLSPDSLAPIRYFYAHVKIYSIDWSWVDPTHFVTGSWDNEIRVWDLSDTSAPLFIYPNVMTFEKGPTRAVAYGSVSFDAIVCCDDLRDCYTGSVYAIDIANGFPSGPRVNRANTTLAMHAACVWDMSYSPWFNMVASVDSTGLVYLSCCLPVHHLQRGQNRTARRKGLPVFTTHCSNLKEGQDTDPAGDKDSLSAEDLHITFKDRSMEYKKDFIQTETEEDILRTSFDKFRPADAYAVCFNPNKASSPWLAVGTKAGFVRLLRMTCVTLESHSAKVFFHQSTQ